MNNIQVIVYLLLTMAITLSANHYIASSLIYRGMTEKVDQNYKKLLRREEQGSDSRSGVLVVGNSYVETSFNPVDHYEHVTMFRVAGMPMIDMLGVIENLPDQPAFDTVLIGLGYNYATPQGGLSSVYDIHFTTNPIRKMWASVPLIRGRSSAATILKEDIKCLVSHSRTAPCDDVLKAPADSTPVVVLSGFDSLEKHRQNLEKSTDIRYQEYLPFVSQLDSRFELYLHRLQKACRMRDIRLYAYTAPIYGKLRQRLSEDVLVRFREAVASVGIDYVDLNLVYPDWGPSMFSDATHVDTSTAGPITTDYLLTFIGLDVVDMN